MVVDHAFRVARGAGRVVEGDGVPLVGRRLPLVVGVAAGQQAFVVEVGKGLHFRSQHVVDLDHAQTGNLRRHLARQLGKFRVGQQDFCVAMAQHEGQRRQVEADIQGIEDGAGHGHAKTRFHHGGRVRQHHGHRVARAHAQLDQAGGQAARARIRFAPGLPHGAMCNCQAIAIYCRCPGDIVERGEGGVVGAVFVEAGIEISSHACLLVNKML